METVEAVVDDEASLDDDDGGTLTLEGLLRLEVKAIALFVSLKPGSCGKIGVEDFPLLALQGADLYSRIAVVVVLSKGALAEL
ncbi:hypothetical protein NC652_041681 [Populus alba x Populus x berolinensis]|nr:hypothetical protein NC652_041681 [Populus alba x Populus x berolinensis]